MLPISLTADAYRSTMLFLLTSTPERMDCPFGFLVEIRNDWIHLFILGDISYPMGRRRTNK